jgi:hypothetical protein
MRQLVALQQAGLGYVLQVGPHQLLHLVLKGARGRGGGGMRWHSVCLKMLAVWVEIGWGLLMIAC